MHVVAAHWGNTLKYEDGTRRLAELRSGIAELRREMRQVRAHMEPHLVRDYVFATVDGSVPLLSLFGVRDDLIIIHNMGTSCAHCTLWADGFAGIYPHLVSCAAFVVSSPDMPGVQQEYAAARGWCFPLVSHQGTPFAADMGYRSRDGGFLPGISVFHRIGMQIVRLSDCELGPGDDYCALWHLLDLLPNGASGWQPRTTYA